VLKNLAYRENDGLVVSLDWDSDDGSVSLTLKDRRDESSDSVPVPADSALDAFYHPFAYVAS
jgi:hypothetical protein